MAEMTLTQPNKATQAPAGSGRDFGSEAAALVLKNATTARSILRVVVLAVRGQLDGSVQYDNNKIERWHPAVEAACGSLQVVRDTLTQTRAAPNVDWFTSLTLVEAMAAALWSQGEKLDEVELESVTQAAIDSLDSLMQGCETEGVLEMARSDKAAAVH